MQVPKRKKEKRKGGVTLPLVQAFLSNSVDLHIGFLVD